MTCALHCLRQNPDARIVVLEKRPHPVSEATHKVGESSVEVGANYFRDFLGLADHLENEQIPKMGLRLFLPGGDNSSIENRLELGGASFPPTPSYQFDRGRFENFLAEECLRRGIEFLDSTSVKDVELRKGKAPHLVSYERDGEETTLETRWVIDACGRAGFLKHRLGLKQNASHQASSAWIRIGRRIKVDDWSDDADWNELHDPEENPRWWSTNHLLGEGYWVWIIPLSSGSTSIGIVTDEKIHPLGDYNSQEKFLDWLDRHEPLLGSRLREAESEIQDFLAIKRYSMRAKRLFSKDRWGVIGDAGYFADPFYSPGNDFIALANYFACDLITRDLAGKSNLVHAPAFNQLFRLYYEGTMLIFEDNYPFFGNHQVMPVKILWDWMVYWTITGHTVLQGRATHLSVYLKNGRYLKRLNDLNTWMQDHFRRWHAQCPPQEVSGRINTCDMTFLMDTNRGLLDKLGEEEFHTRFRKNVAQMETLFWEIVDHSGVECAAPFRRREHPDTVKGSFEVVFRATRAGTDSDSGENSGSSASPEASFPGGESSGSSEESPMPPNAVPTS